MYAAVLSFIHKNIKSEYALPIIITCMVSVYYYTIDHAMYTHMHAHTIDSVIYRV